MATTFVEIDEATGNNQLKFLASTTAQYWATIVQSYSGGVPQGVVLAEWITEGSYSSTNSGAVCNNPGNSDTGTYTGCGISFSFTDVCDSFPPFYKTASGVAAAEAQGEVLASGYCEVVTAANQSSLTTGGAKLKKWAEDQGYSPTLPTSWYNAAWAWGNSSWDTPSPGHTGHYTYDITGLSGSYLIAVIYDDAIYNFA